jgi:hypothetical protein
MTCVTGDLAIGRLAFEMRGFRLKRFMCSSAQPIRPSPKAYVLSHARTFAISFVP